MSQVSFTDAQILQQAKGNALGVIIATIAYLKQHGQSIDAWGCSVGEQFAPGWAAMKGKGAYEVAVAAALNPVSCGATLISVEGDAQHAVAIVEFPALGQALESFGVSLAELDQLMGGAYVPIMRYLGLGYAWQRDGERWTYEFTA